MTAALRLAGRVGFDDLSMRGLAEELDVTPMAIYYHVGNKKALARPGHRQHPRGDPPPRSRRGGLADPPALLHEETTRVLRPYPGIDA